MLDPISDMLTRIRNAQMAGHKEAKIPASKVKLAIAKILEQEGFIESVQKETEDNFESIRVGLKYHVISNTKKQPAISGIERVSKEGQRIYIKSKDIRSVRNKYGIAIISTSKGIMTDRESRKSGLGGEYICKVW
jgi:small subunit ribosomal protein S8